MTIKIEAWQKKGEKTDRCVDKYEICCWYNLQNWLKALDKLHNCEKCQKEIDKRGK